jgi:hypothetical protein
MIAHQKSRIMKTIKYLAFILGLGIIAVSCTKTVGDAYKKFEVGGEIKYPGRPDTAIAHSGLNRIQLSVILGNDPLVTKVRVFYNLGKDSIDVAVKRTSGKDTINVIVPNLAEGNYNFDVYTYDAAGHKSVVVNTGGISYGASYVSSLTNRTLVSLTQGTDGKINLSWGAAAGGELGIEVNYISLAGVATKITVVPTQTLTVLPDYKDNTTLTYRSLYKPDPGAFETFSPPLLSVTLPAFERQFDKTKFALLILPTDVLDGGYGWLQSYLWNENYNPPGFATQNKIPCWFTFDTGAAAALSRFKVWQANDRLYQLESVKTFELYGNNTPASDGSFTGWTKIGSYTSVKPSGLPVGQNSTADIAFAKAGEEFTVAAGTPAFRYYRFKLLTNWGNGNFMTMEEITFYTHDR